MTLSVAGPYSNADECVKLFRKYVKCVKSYWKLLTLGFAGIDGVWFRLLLDWTWKPFWSFMSNHRILQDPKGEESFALSELISGYHPIPHAIVDLSSDEVEAGVFFGIWTRAYCARTRWISNDCHEVCKGRFGVPAFPSWMGTQCYYSTPSDVIRAK